MARNLLEKAGRIQVPPPKSELSSAAPADPNAGLTPAPVKPKTAPGTLMGFMANQSETMKENDLLRQQAARFEGALPTRLLDPMKIAASEWANRHESSFDSSDFAELKAEIGQAGGNVQPIKVRPMPRRSGHGVGSGEGVGPSNPPGVEYEIIYGHRRHRACLELGLPVLSLIEEASEQQLFVQMERENRNRADLSAWEQGVMYLRALDSGLYPSNRQLATAIGRDLGDVGRALALARLPKAVIEAFASPLELQFRWAKPLSDVQQGDPEGLLARATALKGRKLSAKDTLAALVNGGGAGQGVGLSNPRDKVELEKDGAVAATITFTASGQATVKLHAALDLEGRKKLVSLLEGFI